MNVSSHGPQSEVSQPDDVMREPDVDAPGSPSTKRAPRAVGILVTRMRDYEIVERSIVLYGVGIMSNAHYSDAAVTKLRAIVDTIDQEISHAPPTAALRAAWAELVDVLALGPAPQTRECPACHGIGMRAASRCGHCWAALEALPPLSNGTPSQGDA